MHRHNLHNCFRFICCICCVQCYVEQISQFTLNKCIAACPPTSATFEKKSYIWSGRLPFEAKRRNLWKFIKQLHLIFFFYNLVAIELCNMSEFSYVVEWTQKVPGEKSVTPINTVYALGYILEIYLKKKKRIFRIAWGDNIFSLAIPTESLKSLQLQCYFCVIGCRWIFFWTTPFFTAELQSFGALK